LISVSKSYLHFKNLYFEIATVSENVVTFTNARFIKFTSCVFYHNLKPSVGGNALTLSAPSGQTLASEIYNCAFYNCPYIQAIGTVAGDATVLQNSLFVNCYNEVFQFAGCTSSIYNCTFYGGLVGVRLTASGVATVRNCLFTGLTTAVQITSGTYTEDYNRYIGNSVNVSGTYTPGSNSTSNGVAGIESGYSLLHSLNNQSVYGNVLGGPNNAFGTSTSAPTTDLFGIPWSNIRPDAGAITYRNPSGVGPYISTERNASVMSMQAGSTSRSIYVYLGVTGLTTSTTGLQAYYTKEDGIPVSIPLVAQTPTGAWVAGGFAEVSAINQPGIYRLDIPDAAISAGYNQTVVTVRGASGTNGAVVTIQDPPERGSAIYMGPYKLISNHMGADNPLEVLKGVQAPVDIQLVDNSGGGVDITGATVTAKIYNASSQLIDTYTCTPTYALDGRCSFNLDTTVTDNSGHYTVTVTRQVGGNIVVFGPLRCLVRAN